MFSCVKKQSLCVIATKINPQVETFLHEDLVTSNPVAISQALEIDLDRLQISPEVFVFEP